MRIGMALFAVSIQAAVIFAAAEGAITVSFINRGAPKDGNTTADGFTGWIIRLTSDSGDIEAVGASGTGYGIGGPMVQRWTASGEDGVYTTKSIAHVASNGSPSVWNFDSHLLPPASNIFAFPTGFDESLGRGAFPPPGSTVGGGMPINTLAAGIGVSGSDGFIKGQYDIPVGDRSLVWDLAYIVLRDDELNGVTGRVLVLTAGGPFAVQIPEPGTILVIRAALFAWPVLRGRVYRERIDL